VSVHTAGGDSHHQRRRPADRFGYQTRQTDGPGPTTAAFEAPPRALPQRQKKKKKKKKEEEEEEEDEEGAHVVRKTRNTRNIRQPDLTVNRPTVSSQRSRREKKEVYNAESARAVRARVAHGGGIGVALSAGDEREHATSLALARRMQRGDGRDDDGSFDDSSPRSSRRSGHSAGRHRHRQPTSPRASAASEAYQQPKNTREPDEYLALLLGKTPQDAAAKAQSPRTSPGTVARAKQLEKELARRRRLLELEQGLGDRIIARTEGGYGDPDPDDGVLENGSPRSRQLHAAANRRGHQQRARNLRKGHDNNDSSAAPFDTEPVARRINRRKEMERKKIQDGNVNRLIRAVKSGIVELQLCVWEWQKEKTFKSKDVARTRRVSLRRKLHRLLEDHRRSVVELVAAVRHWQSERGMAAFLWNDLDIMDLLRRMPSICGSSSDEAHGLAPGTTEAYECEFGLGFLGESDKVVGFLGFAVGDGDIVRRLDGTTDCNMFALIPEDRIRAARLLGEDAEAEHLARSLLYGVVGVGGGDDDDEEEDKPGDVQFPFSCPEDMPLVCRLCHAGERTDDGRCPNCGHCGGDDWRELDAEARVQRFAEEREWFEEDKAENVRRRREAQAQKLNKGAKGTAKALADIKYQPKISDRDLLRFAKVQRVVLGQQRAQLEATGALPSPVRAGASKYGDEEGERMRGVAYPTEEVEVVKERQHLDEMEGEVEAQMMQQLRMMQERDQEELEEQKHYEQKNVEDDEFDLGAERAETFAASGIADERSVYEGKYDQEEGGEVGAVASMSPPVAAAASEGRGVAERKGGEEADEEEEEEELTEIDREFAQMQQQLSVEAKAEDLEEPETTPTISTFAAGYYEDLKSDALEAAANGVKSEFRFVESKFDAAKEEEEEEEGEEERVMEEQAPAPVPSAVDEGIEQESNVMAEEEKTVVVEEEEEEEDDDDNRQEEEQLEGKVGSVMEGEVDVVKAPAPEPERLAPVKKAVAFVVGGDGAVEEEVEEEAPYEGIKAGSDEATASDVNEAVESKQVERPTMAETLGEAAPVKQPSARERRMAALAAAERRAGKK
jgi:hypothetical protein